MGFFSYRRYDLDDLDACMKWSRERLQVAQITNIAKGPDNATSNGPIPYNITQRWGVRGQNVLDCSAKRVNFEHK